MRLWGLRPHPTSALSKYRSSWGALPQAPTVCGLRQPSSSAQGQESVSHHFWPRLPKWILSGFQMVLTVDLITSSSATSLTYADFQINPKYETEGSSRSCLHPASFLLYLCPSLSFLTSNCLYSNFMELPSRPEYPSNRKN